MTPLTKENVFNELASAADSKCWNNFKLPNGKIITVVPTECFETLQVVLKDPEFIDALKNSIDNAINGEAVPLDKNYFEKKPKRTKNIKNIAS